MSNQEDKLSNDEKMRNYEEAIASIKPSAGSPVSMKKVFKEIYGELEVMKFYSLSVTSSNFSEINENNWSNILMDMEVDGGKTYRVRVPYEDKYMIKSILNYNSDAIIDMTIAVSPVQMIGVIGAVNTSENIRPSDWGQWLNPRIVTMSKMRDIKEVDADIFIKYLRANKIEVSRGEIEERNSRTLSRGFELATPMEDKRILLLKQNNDMVMIKLTKEIIILNKDRITPGDFGIRFIDLRSPRNSFTGNIKLEAVASSMNEFNASGRSTDSLREFFKDGFTRYNLKNIKRDIEKGFKIADTQSIGNEAIHIDLDLMRRVKYTSPALRDILDIMIELIDQSPKLLQEEYSNWYGASEYKNGYDSYPLIGKAIYIYIYGRDGLFA